MKRTRALIPLLAALSAHCLWGQQAVLPDSPRPGAPAQRCAQPQAPAAIQPNAVDREVRPGGRLFPSDWASIGVAATLRVLDYTTTEKAMAYPQDFHEVLLPNGLVQNKAGFAAFEAGSVAANYYAYRWMARHGMHAFAVRAQWIYNLSLVYPVMENYRVLSERNLQ